jgi:hypothetical protein
VECVGRYGRDGCDRVRTGLYVYRYVGYGRLVECTAAETCESGDGMYGSVCQCGKSCPEIQVEGRTYKIRSRRETGLSVGGLGH